MALIVSLPTGLRIVTGAASGMGEAVAHLLADAEEVLLIDRDEQRLAAVAAQLPCGHTEILAGDISDPAFADKFSNAIAGRSVGVFIHCAGLSPTMADAARILDVNLAAPMRLLQVVRPRMEAGAAAVLFASTAGHMVGTTFDTTLNKAIRPEQVAALLEICPDPGIAYAVSKRGVHLLVQREAAAFGAQGARIVSLSPGVIDTPMGRTEMAQQPIMTHLVENSPLKRAAHAQEVANVAVFLASTQASFVTGTDVLVDGGSVGAAHAATL